MQADWANDAIKGYLQAHNQDLIALADFPKAVIRKDYASLQEASIDRVALISGGGSGHEPAHLGFLGHGMLSAAVCGDLFASPSTASILAAIRFLGAHNKAGVLLIVKNYTGDRLNFGLAAKRAQFEGINVDMVLIDDDWASASDDENQRDASVGRRGLCGTVFIHKIAGALAEQRKTLKEIKETLEYILKNNRLRTVGVSLSGRVALPGESEKNATQTNDVEIGMGIHGEPGRKRVPLAPSHELVASLLDEFKLFGQKQICLMVNNLGGLSNLELYLLVNDCLKYARAKRPDAVIKRVYSGTLMTSLNMNGFSITTLALDDTNSETILSLLDANTDAPSWPRSSGKDVEAFEYTSSPFTPRNSGQASSSFNRESYVKFTSPEESEFFKQVLRTVSEDLINARDTLNELDAACGDGDCGNSLARIGKNTKIYFYLK